MNTRCCLAQLLGATGLLAFCWLSSCGGKSVSSGNGGAATGGSAQDSSFAGSAGKTDASPDTGGGAQGGYAGTASDAAGGDSSDSAPPPECLIDSGDIVSSFKSCQSNDDCEIDKHEVDCCETMKYVGISKSYSNAFATCEAAWETALGLCNCPSQPPTAEDGNPIGDGAAMIVECTDFTMSGGVCMTRVQ